jgi:hypothetical protein
MAVSVRLDGSTAWALPRRLAIRSALLAVAAAGMAGCAHRAEEPDQLVRSAWVQHTADQGIQVRAITAAAVCPSLQTPGAEPLPMAVRAGPAEIPARAGGAQADTKSSSFPVLSCEAAWPAGRQRVKVGPVELAAPRADVKRIVLLGDTGCRLKASDKAFQGCNDPARWPFAEVARRAAAMRPDQVIHVGDYHYRESPCPAGREDCAGSPWGYGYDAWEADLFRPAAPLLTAAPWVFVRGNHESCSRAGQGWFRFLDARPWSARGSCDDPANDAVGDFTEPYALALTAGTQLIVFDSARVAGRAYGPQDPALATYVRQLRQVAELARRAPHNLLVKHHPVLAYVPGARGETLRPAGDGLRSALAAAAPERLYAAGVDTVIAGHLHTFQALGFASDHPSALVVGHGGSQMDGTVDPAAALAGSLAPGVRLDAFATRFGFGFATLDRVGEGWRLSEWSVGGELLHSCALDGPRLSCAPARP